MGRAPVYSSAFKTKHVILADSRIFATFSPQILHILVDFIERKGEIYRTGGTPCWQHVWKNNTALVRQALPVALCWGHPVAAWQ